MGALARWWRTWFQRGACRACGEDARRGARVCEVCLRRARRKARADAGGGNGPRQRIRTLQGFIVQSEGEAAIADHLFKNGVLFQYEPRVGPYRPDFLVPHARVIIEYYGMKSADYTERRRRKEAYYAERGYRVIALKRGNLSRLGESLKGLGAPPRGLNAELKRQRDA